MENFESYRYCIQAVTGNEQMLLLTSNDFEIDFIQSGSVKYLTDIQIFDSFDDAKVYIVENEIEKWCKNNYNSYTSSNELHKLDNIVSLNILPILIGIKYSETIRITDI